MKTAKIRCSFCTFTRQQCITCITYHSLARKSKSNCRQWQGRTSTSCGPPLGCFFTQSCCFFLPMLVAVFVAIKRHTRVSFGNWEPPEAFKKFLLSWPFTMPQTGTFFPVHTTTCSQKSFVIAVTFSTLSLYVTDTATSSA